MNRFDQELPVATPRLLAMATFSGAGPDNETVQGCDENERGNQAEAEDEPLTVNKPRSGLRKLISVEDGWTLLIRPV